MDFVEHIVRCIEENSNLDLTNSIVNNEDMVHPGQCKSYQLMSTLLGDYRFYLVMHYEKYLDMVVKGWEIIKEKHFTVAGGPWTREMDYNANIECFARNDAFHPENIVVEGCSSPGY